MLALDDVYKSYAEGDRAQVVLRGLSVRFEAGESVALVGPSGSGKSTLLNLLSGLDQPDSGTVSLRGQDLSRLRDADRTLLRRRHVGFVFQFFNLLPALTVMDNLLLPQNLLGVSAKRARERAQSLLQAVGLAARADSFADTLSGGEQQRVAVARAVVHEPAVVLADEPTGNLDSTTSSVVLTLLKTLVEQQNCMLIMATHSQAAASLCARAVALRDGTLVTLSGTDASSSSTSPIEVQ